MDFFVITSLQKLSIHMRGLFILLLLSFAFSCGNESTSDTNNNAESNKEEPKHFDFEVDQNGLILYEQAGGKGRVLKELKKGEQLEDLYEESDFLSKIEIQNQSFELPWIKVKTADDTFGWIYPCPLQIKAINGLTMGDILRERLLRSLIGVSQWEELQRYNNAFAEADELMAVLDVYKSGRVLRDKMVSSIEKKLFQRQEDELINLFWLKEEFPGFVPQLVAEGTSYYLFIDYNAFLSFSAVSEERIDDDYFAFAASIYPDDGVEYFYPIWTMQTWDYGGHSLLGRGIHFNVLGKISSLLAEDSPFQSELLEIKSKLFEDITGTEVTYWESKENIQKEVTQIIENFAAYFSETELSILKSRMDQFNEPEVYEIQMNLQAGLEE